jgi:hypothetical protein
MTEGGTERAAVKQETISAKKMAIRMEADV